MSEKESYNKKNNISIDILPGYQPQKDAAQLYDFLTIPELAKMYQLIDGDYTARAMYEKIRFRTYFKKVVVSDLIDFATLLLDNNVLTQERFEEIASDSI